MNKENTQSVINCRVGRFISGHIALCIENSNNFPFKIGDKFRIYYAEDGGGCFIVCEGKRYYLDHYLETIFKDVENE